MKRTALTDGTNRWFNQESSKSFKENTRWDGNNHISLSTGSQWRHEMLFRTKSQKWILNFWSQYQGEPETYNEITDQEAAEWFIKNEYEIEDLPEDIQSLISKKVEDLEI